MSIPSSTDAQAVPPTRLQSMLRDRVAETAQQTEQPAATAAVQPDERRVAAGGLDLVV